MSVTGVRGWVLCSLWVVLAGCATRSADVRPLPANPADFRGWSCARIDDELDRVQQRAADVAYAVDARAGQNIVAIGVGLAVFWPALLAMRPDGLEAEELARLRGRYEALRVAGAQAGCPYSVNTISATRAAAMPVVLGERLVYEERLGQRAPLQENVMRVSALRRDETEFTLELGRGHEVQRWRQDRLGNVLAGPPDMLRWERLLRPEMKLGDVLSGHMSLPADDSLSVRVRGQVVAEGPQTVAGRRFDVAVIELFGDVRHGDLNSRMDGVIVVDKPSGILLRLEVRGTQGDMNVMRRLVRIEAPR